eukprot:TRINITY_DN33978_c0_g1_i2.p1 TRINITY_DN33978_c0_g1~~TRINITY_DN33978_c0_g1_i2.p1  ORF type:complete len:276 (-),score=35.06 TRINITY_DN33978_c0_g1_i2:259-1086(-)
MDRQISILDLLHLSEIAQTLGIASCDPVLLARLSLAQSQLHAIVSTTEFAASVANELCSQGLLWAKRCNSLKEISLGIDVDSICSKGTKNHLYFQMGGGTAVRPATKPLLDSAALLGRRYKGLLFHIDSHVARGAPAGMATSTSQSRATSVVAELANRGMAEDRTTVRAWGRKISSLWQEPEDGTAARAELFFSLGGVQFPLREAYYSLVPENQRPPIGTHEPPSDDEGVDLRLVQLPDGQILPIALLRALIQAQRRDNDDDDEDDSGGSDGSDP